MPLQALVLDEMIDNDTELIALNSNDDDIFYLISLRRNHKDHVPRIRGYYEEVIPRYTDLQLDLHLDLQFRHHFRMYSTAQFRHHFRMYSTVQQLCLLLGNWPYVPSEFNCIAGPSTANWTSKTSSHYQKKSVFVY